MTLRKERTLAGLACVAFVGLGLPDGLLGVAWPSMRSTFGVPLDALGALFASFTAGFVLSSFAGGRSVRALGLGGLLAASCAATGLSLLGYALSGSWSLVVGLGFVAGLGAGGIDTGINTYAAMRHGPRFLNLLHACWGVGATLGPALMTAVLVTGRPWPLGYALVAGAQLALAVVFAVTQGAWPAAGASAHETSPESFAGTLRLRGARVGILLFAAYTGLELGIGAWAFTVLTEGRGRPPAVAGGWTSLYWLGLTVGRLAAAAIVPQLGAPLLLRSAMVLLAAGVSLLAAGVAPSLDLVGLLIAGVAAGPIFPTLIAQTPVRLGAGHAANAVGFQIAAASLGAALWPAALGVLGARRGLEALALGLVALALVVLALNEWAIQSVDERARPRLPA